MATRPLFESEPKLMEPLQNIVVGMDSLLKGLIASNLFPVIYSELSGTLWYSSCTVLQIGL